MSEIPSLLPWQRGLWEALSTARRAGRLPHALLISGPTGLGKHQLATLLAQSLLCENPTTDYLPCGQCRACQLMAAGSHPDFTEVCPPEDKRGIGVDQVRELAHFQSLHSQYPRGKVALINPADGMNANAANALLKTLEEPASNTVLILLTDRPTRLLPTIRSRCQQWQLKSPPINDKATLVWLRDELGEGAGGDPAVLLQINQGAPLQAAAMSGEELARRGEWFDTLAEVAEGRRDPLGAAGQWEKADLERYLDWWRTGVDDMVRLKWRLPHDGLSHPDQLARLQRLQERVDLTGLYKIIELLQQAKKMLEGQANRLLLLENLFVSWARMTGV